MEANNFDKDLLERHKKQLEAQAKESLENHKNQLEAQSKEILEAHKRQLKEQAKVETKQVSKPVEEKTQRYIYGIDWRSLTFLGLTSPIGKFFSAICFVLILFLVALLLRKSP